MINKSSWWLTHIDRVFVPESKSHAPSLLHTQCAKVQLALEDFGSVVYDPEAAIVYVNGDKEEGGIGVEVQVGSEVLVAGVGVEEHPEKAHCPPRTQHHSPCEILNLYKQQGGQQGGECSLQ